MTDKVESTPTEGGQSVNSKGDAVDGLIQRRPAFSYNMSHKPLGTAIIVSIETYDSRLEMPSRNDSEVDVINLTTIFKTWGLEVVVVRNQTVKQVLDLFEAARLADHSQVGCFVGVILTHGQEGNYVYMKDNILKLSKITDKFKGDQCSTLVGKPKLFFIQACRGDDPDPGADQPDSGADQPDSVPCGLIPIEADFLYVYATAPGYVAFKNENGSWFVQSMVKAFEDKRNNRDLLHFMTEVNSYLADFMSLSRDPELDGKKQSLWVVSTLRKLVYF